MQAVECATCQTTVLVWKYSAEQTSIQWQADSAVCPERAALAVGQTCPALSETIAAAVVAGTVEVQTRDE